MADRTPRWEVKNENSFASVVISLPPNQSIHCESDAVITMSETVDVLGVLSGGLLSGLARTFLTQESFFTTKVHNGSTYATGDVLVAPADPGGIMLHRIFPGEDLFLTSGAYVAGDEGVKVESAVQTQIGNSLMSGTGFFTLRASGRGNLAISAYGSIHKYVLAAGEKRKVDNGHLVAWSSSMKYRMKLASGRSGIIGSMTSGEGFHCEFEGPGFVLIQSHKPNMDLERKPKSRRNMKASPISLCIGLFLVLIFFIVAIVLMFLSLSNSMNVDASYSRGRQQSYRPQQSYNNLGQNNEF